MKNRLKILVMPSFLLNFLRCSGRKANTEHKQNTQDSLSEQVAKSIDDFKNRAIFKKLSTEIIDKTPNDQLIQTIFDNLTEKIPEDYTKKYETVSNFSKSQQAIYMIWLLEAEVNNGGFNQYYFNSSGQFAKLTSGALTLVGADKFANLMMEANKIYDKEYKNITNEHDGTIEGFSKSYIDNPLNNCDHTFYELYETEDLQKIQINFIRKNKTEFIDR